MTVLAFGFLSFDWVFGLTVVVLAPASDDWISDVVDGITSVDCCVVGEGVTVESAGAT